MTGPGIFLNVRFVSFVEIRLKILTIKVRGNYGVTYQIGERLNLAGKLAPVPGISALWRWQ